MVFYDYLKNLSQVRLKYCQEKVLGSQPASLPFSAQNISLAFLPFCSLYCQCLLLIYKSCFLTRTRIFCYVTLGPGISINFLSNGEKWLNFSHPFKVFPVHRECGFLSHQSTRTSLCSGPSTVGRSLKGSDFGGMAFSRHQQSHTVIPIVVWFCVPMWAISCQMPVSAVEFLLRKIPGSGETLALIQCG